MLYGHAGSKTPELYTLNPQHWNVQNRGHLPLSEKSSERHIEKPGSVDPCI